jgi:DNA-binding CsgD family transcriptional regulator
VNNVPADLQTPSAAARRLILYRADTIVQYRAYTQARCLWGASATTSAPPAVIVPCCRQTPRQRDMTTRTEPGTALTDGELKVVRLVAMGDSNGQIAEKLFISVRTVEAHLRNAYAKTGTRNRVELTNWLLGGA